MSAPQITEPTTTRQIVVHEVGRLLLAVAGAVLWIVAIQAAVTLVLWWEGLR